MHRNKIQTLPYMVFIFLSSSALSVCPEDVVMTVLWGWGSSVFIFVKDDHKAMGNWYFSLLFLACVSCIPAAAEYTANIQTQGPILKDRLLLLRAAQLKGSRSLPAQTWAQTGLQGAADFHLKPTPPTRPHANVNMSVCPSNYFKNPTLRFPNWLGNSKKKTKQTKKQNKKNPFHRQSLQGQRSRKVKSCSRRCYHTSSLTADCSQRHHAAFKPPFSCARVCVCFWGFLLTPPHPHPEDDVITRSGSEDEKHQR